MSAIPSNKAMPIETADAVRPSKFIDCMGVFIGDNIIGFGIPKGDINSETMRTLADKAAEWGLAALRCARLRGDNDDDPAGTQDDAIMAAEFISGFAIGLRGAADKLARYEKSAKAGVAP